MNIKEEYIKNIELNTNFSKDDILEKVKETRETNKAFTEIGALYIIKKELGLNFTVNFEILYHELSIKKRDYEDENFEYYEWKTFIENYPEYGNFELMKEDLRISSKEYEDLKGSPRNALNFLKKFLVDYLNQYTHDYYKLNDYLTIKLQLDKAYIYVGNVLIEECVYSILKEVFERGIDLITISRFYDKERYFRCMNALNSLHSKSVNLNQSIEKFTNLCSMLKNWEEKNYDTNLLNYKLSCSLLKDLIKQGDPKAQEVYEKEIGKQFEQGKDEIVEFLIKNKFLDYFSEDSELSLLARVMEILGVSELYKLKKYYNHKFLERPYSLKKSQINEFSHKIHQIEDVFREKAKDTPVYFVQNLIHENHRLHLFQDQDIIDIKTQTISDVFNTDLMVKYTDDLNALYSLIKKSVNLVKEFRSIIDIDVLYLPKLAKFCNEGYFIEFLKVIEIDLKRTQKGILYFLVNRTYGNNNFLDMLDKTFIEKVFDTNSLEIKEICDNILKTAHKNGQYKEKYALIIPIFESFFERNISPAIKIHKHLIIEKIKIKSNDISLTDYRFSVFSNHFIHTKKVTKRALNTLLGIIEQEAAILNDLLRSKENFNFALNISIENGHVIKLFVRDFSISPENIGKFSYLKDLKVMSGEIYDLDEILNKLQNLEILELECYEISSLPDSIGNLQKLKTLILYGQMKTLPDSIRNLKNLTVLRLRRNKIEKLPESILKLKNLSKIWLWQQSKFFKDDESIVILNKLKERGVEINNSFY